MHVKHILGIARIWWTLAKMTITSKKSYEQKKNTDRGIDVGCPDKKAALEDISERKWLASFFREQFRILYYKNRVLYFHFLGQKDFKPQKILNLKGNLKLYHQVCKYFQIFYSLQNIHSA